MKINQVSKLFITTYSDDFAIYRRVSSNLTSHQHSVTSNKKDRFYDLCCGTSLRMLNEKESNSFYKCNQ